MDDPIKSGRGRGGRGAPFGGPTAKKELRRPMFAVSPPPPAEPEDLPSASETSADDVAERLNQINIQSDEGNFNVNASEFVPKFGLSVAADVFFPHQEEEMMPIQEEEKHGPAVSILYEAMYQLTLEPGRFDSIARQLTQDLNLAIEEYSTMENLAEVILENGINEPNFRYTGARLCDYLSLHLTMIIEGATLRQILMQKCNREFKLRDKLIAENSTRLRGFTIFIAELFQQLEIQVGAVVQRVQVLGNAILDLIITLGTHPDKENIKCIVQTLKCCGSVLEEEERSKPGNNGTTPILDKTFKFLVELSSNPELEPGLGDMLLHLVKLRSANWGHSPPSTAQVLSDLPGPLDLEPVFYAPDGQVLTMEEYDFLQEYGLNDEDNFGEVQWSTGEDNPGMGDEMEAAYDEFLRGQS